MSAEFTYYFRTLVAALGERPGWYGVFAARERDAALAFDSGAQLPPWDVVHTVLHELAMASGRARADTAEVAHAYALHHAAVSARDAVPGAARDLRTRLDAATRTREAAADRAREAARAHDRAAAGPDPAVEARFASILAWCRDDLTRASARCDELATRLRAVSARTGPAPAPAEPVPPEHSSTAPTWAAGHRRTAEPPRGARFAGAPEGPPREAAPPAPQAPARTPRGARFAGAPEAKGPAATTGPGGAAPAPRGARFAGAPDRPARPERRAPDPRLAAEARAEAARLGELRRSGQSGAAYLVLCGAADGPAELIPYLARELESTGLGAEVATLLWEVAALPPDALASAAAALAAEGRVADCRALLRQTAARPPGDVAVVADRLLHGAGLPAEAAELLTALARARPPADAAALVRARPSLAQPLLTAAAQVSASLHRDISAALRTP